MKIVELQIMTSYQAVLDYNLDREHALLNEFDSSEERTMPIAFLFFF